MDVRLKGKLPTSPQQLQKQKVSMSEQQINDSLIFNIMKKIQLRERLIGEYKQQKQQTGKSFLAKYVIHSKIPVYYTALLVFSKIAKIVYLKPGQSASSIFTIPNFLFHICVIVSLNEYYKYQNIFKMKHEMGEEYRIYQQNVEQLMDQKLENFSIMNKLRKNQYLDQQKLMEIFKYRLVV